MAKAKLKVAQTASALPQKFLELQKLLPVFALLAIVTPVYAFNSTQLNEQERQEWEQLIQRFNQPRTFDLLAGRIWSLTHGGDSKKVQEILNLFMVLDPRSGRRPAITAREFTNRIAAFLESDDDPVAGFAATLLAVTGDLSFAPQIAKLLDKKDPPQEPEHYVHDITSRGSAAYALSLLGAKEYVPKVALMLKSKNDYDRAGAATALAEFKATEYANDIAELLKTESGMLAGDDSPIHQIAGLLKDKDDSVRMAALTALGILRAKKYELQVVRHLKDPDSAVRLHAAFALVLMDTDRYAKRIIPTVEHLYRENLNLVDAQPFVEEELRQINNRFRNSFQRMKNLR